MSARLRGLGLVLKVILGLVAMRLSKLLSYVSLSSTGAKGSRSISQISTHHPTTPILHHSNPLA
jgi:hypothetical protein